jgi:hypothetical protein
MLTQELYERLSAERFSENDLKAFESNSATIGQTCMATAIIMYAGLKAYADLMQAEADFTLEDCVDWSDELMTAEGSATVQKIFNTWTESHAYKSRIELKKKMDEMSAQIGIQSEDTPLERLELSQPITTS